MQQTYYGGPQVIPNRPVVNTPIIQRPIAPETNKPQHKIRRIYSQKTTKNKANNQQN